MWSVNREGEADERLKENRGAVMGIDVEAKRAGRQDLVALAHPQHGVDTMRDEFTGTEPVPGVVDVTAAPAGADAA
jgi:hypothetical protein